MFFEQFVLNMIMADKALLHLWAEYRWGVFEESGFPGNLKYPYLNKNAEDTEWEVNACSDTKLQGSYLLPYEFKYETLFCQALYL